MSQKRPWYGAGTVGFSTVQVALVSVPVQASPGPHKRWLPAHGSRSQGAPATSGVTQKSRQAGSCAPVQRIGSSPRPVRHAGASLLHREPMSMLQSAIRNTATVGCLNFIEPSSPRPATSADRLAKVPKLRGRRKLACRSCFTHRDLTHRVRSAASHSSRWILRRVGRPEQQSLPNNLFDALIDTRSVGIAPLPRRWVGARCRCADSTAQSGPPNADHDEISDQDGVKSEVTMGRNTQLPREPRHRGREVRENRVRIALRSRQVLMTCQLLHHRC